MTRTTKGYQVSGVVGIIWIIEKADGLLMMNFESVTYFFLSNAAPLTGVFISLACLSVLSAPILSVVWFPSTLPGRVIFSGEVMRLPLAHAVAIAKVVLINLGVSSSKVLPTPFTVDRLTSPPKKGAATFRTASYRLGDREAIESVRFNRKGVSAYGAVKSWGGCVLPAIFIFATSVTKPKARRIVILAAWLSLQILTAGGAVNKRICNHGVIIPHFVACQNLSRRGRAIEISPAYCGVILQRMQDAFGITGVLID